MAEERILLTGASGYVGGRLLPALEASGRRVRCLARRPEALASRVGVGTEVVAGDLLAAEPLPPALEEVHTAYYLVRAAGQGHRDREAAERFAQAAVTAGVRKIVYLSGPEVAAASAGPGGCCEIGRILRESGVPTLEFRASIIIGSGSLSFELVRGLVEGSPLMAAPRWVYSLAQPIAIEDVIAYLLEALAVELEQSQIVEIGGLNQMGYSEIMHEYARQRGLRRLIVPVPVYAPKLSCWWLRLATSLYAPVGRRLIEGARRDVVVRDAGSMRRFAVQPMSLGQAVARALRNEGGHCAATRWSDAYSSHGEERSPDGIGFVAPRVDMRSVQLSCSAEAAFRPIRRIGGRVGWYWGSWLWRLRGFLDLLLGGPGLRRGRRDPEYLWPGDAVDFWRVEEVEADRLLRLRAQMKLPGHAWLQFEVEAGDGGCVVRQTATFDPVGLWGLLYWYGVYPLHALVFGGMLRGIVRAIDDELKKI